MPAPSPMDTDDRLDPAALASAETVTAFLAPPGAAPADPRAPRPRGRRRARETGGPGERGAPAGGAGPDAASDVVRWAVFCCALVPVVLVVYGTSLGGAAGTALGLAAVTAACRVLLRRSERGLRAERHSRS
ncbi:hypothetical protein ACFY8W_29820 [Streptomyces sp. NPDC012637]|uniref:hypothetical protein n=1 Tax=Streptomyces sp. NPDC012637 TaxID=3364842 RepID=UPI0036EEDB2F